MGSKIDTIVLGGIVPIHSVPSAPNLKESRGLTRHTTYVLQSTTTDDLATPESPMWFDIPNEYLETPEAQRLLGLYAEYHRICEIQRTAYTEKRNETDPEFVAELAKRNQEIEKQVFNAVAEFDKATGEPKPIALDPTTHETIESQFAQNECAEVAAKLSKTLAYLRRGSVSGERVIEYVLRLAKGNLGRLNYYADEARRDFRNVVYWAKDGESTGPDFGVAEQPDFDAYSSC